MDLFYPPELKCSKDVIIKNSQTHGKGLFAVKKINKGTVVAFYDGICVKFEDEYDNEDCVMVSVCSGSTNYIQNLAGGVILAGFPNPSKNRFGIATYANTGFVNTKPDQFDLIVKHNNLEKETYQRNGKIGMKYIASRSIKPGEELCINYGYDYWKCKHKEISIESIHELQKVFGMDHDVELNFKKWKMNFKKFKELLSAIWSM
jgi:hypothetical protein